MALKENIITIKDGDQELTFRVKQMPATKLEGWLIRAALLIAGAGAGAGLPGLEGLRDGREAGVWLLQNAPSLLPRLGHLDFEKAKPLMDELLACCWRKIGSHDQQCLPESVDDFIQDVGTLLKLRGEAIKINLGFLSRGAEGGPGSPDTTNTATR
jgi:hypothetical protein